METSDSMDLADISLARATQVFVKRHPEIHLFAARFREQPAAYQLVHAEISPGLLEAIIKHANMECRLGNLEHACNLYEQVIAIEKGKEHSQALPLLYAQYSRFLFLVSSWSHTWFIWAKSVAPSSTPSVMAPYLSAQNQWTAGYGQPQAWPQVAQAQVQGQAQQYPGYGQQAGYGAYAGYGSNYTQRQVPASVPQNATYGAYSTTYPTQVAVQPSYAPPHAAPAATATLAPPQQPAAVAPLAYYNTSYY